MESEVILSDNKIFFISGINRDTGSSNGCGKSALKEAILFALFGKTKVRGNDIVRRGQKKCRVEVDLYHGKASLQVTRIKSGSTSELSVVVNGNLLQGTLTEVQIQLEKLLGVTCDQFINYSVIDHVRFLDLSDFSSTDLRMTLQEVIGLDQLQKVLEKMREYKNSLDRVMEKKQVRFFPSDKRLQILNKYKSEFSTKMLELDMFLASAGKSFGSLTNEVYQCDNESNRLDQAQTKVVTQGACPLCNANLPTDKKLALLNEYQIKLTELATTKITKQEAALKIKQDLDIKKVEQEKLRSELLKCFTRITQLEECKKSQKCTDDVVVELKLYLSAIDLIQQYITGALIELASQVEDQMNADLTRLTDFYCKINLQKVTAKGVTIPSCDLVVYRGDYEYSYNMLSSGEKTLVTLVFKLVLSSLKGFNDLLMIDEGLDRLDEVNRERVLTLLESSPYTQIFLISHREDLSHLKSASKLLVKKEQNISSVVGV
jgi:DNA repair exonuclease SbcCD ATPase subunit